jgi:hypothetical protein
MSTVATSLINDASTIGPFTEEISLQPDAPASTTTEDVSSPNQRSTEMSAIITSNSGSTVENIQGMIVNSN